MPRPVSSRRFTWLPKLLLAVLAPLVVLGGLELTLRLVNSGRDTRYFIPDESAPAGTYRSNPRYTELFFPASFGLKPVNFRLPQQKPSGTKRIFLIGESAAMGVPEPGFGMAPQLEAMLRLAHPGARIEVYNLGITAINSHAILPIVRQAVDFEPDLFVFYMGNNEVVGPYGPGSAITDRTPPLALIRASLWLKSTRSGQLLESIFQRVGQATASRNRDWRGMEMFAEKTVPSGDPRLDAVYQNFEANLHDMLQLAEDAGVPSVVSTVAVNLSDCAPFVSRPDQDGVEADEHFRQGRALLKGGQTEAGLAHLRQAREFDALRFRADARLNQIIRDETRAAPRAHLADTAAALAPGGRTLFFEHVHLNFTGNHAVALNLAAIALPLLYPDQPPPSLPSAATIAAAIGFTDVGRLSQWQAMNDLVTRPPFTGQSTYAEDRTYALNTMRAINQRFTPDAMAAAAGVINAARIAKPDDPFLAFHAAKVAAQRGDFKRALTLLDEHDQYAPVNAESTVLRAFLLAQTGQPADAVARLTALAHEEPFYPQSYPLLASLWSALKSFDEGRSAFASWVEQMPDNRGVLLAYAQLLDASGDHAAAIAQWEAVLAIVPDDERALLPLIEDRFEQEHYDEALDLMVAAHTYNPRNFANNDRLVQMYQQRGDQAATLRFMRDLIASGPVSATFMREFNALSVTQP